MNYFRSSFKHFPRSFLRTQCAVLSRKAPRVQLETAQGIPLGISVVVPLDAPPRMLFGIPPRVFSKIPLSVDPPGGIRCSIEVSTGIQSGNPSIFFRNYSRNIFWNSFKNSNEIQDFFSKSLLDFSRNSARSFFLLIFFLEKSQNSGVPLGIDSKKPGFFYLTTP